MATQNFKRKLAAILHADVKGYSRLIGEDEEATVSTLTTYMEVMRVLIVKHQGHVVSGAGDSLLAEFSSVVDAVRCAVKIQNDLKAENAELPEDRQVVFRIGINLGDVIEKDGDLLGDGVNIAARVEALADGGGICITRSAYDQVKKKLNLGYEYLGAHQVKNITEPVRVYKVLPAPEYAGQLIGEPKTPKLPSKKSSIAIFAILALVVATAIWYFYPRSPETEPASIEKMAYPLPEKPSIAVLPFNNMSGDPDQEYFSDGITEHIITSLSKVPYIFVIARTSTFAYKDQAIKINQIAEELGVRYVLEGSVQRSKDQVRITAQLIDATTGHHLWADSYDRKLDDLFSIQDDIAMQIMAALQVKISAAKLGKSFSTKTTNLKAYEKYIESFEHLMSRTKSGTLQARKLAREAITLDPEYGAPYVVLAFSHTNDVWYYRTKSREKSLQTAEQLIQKAIDLSGHDSFIHQVLGVIYVLRRDYDKAIDECQKSIELSPNSAESYFFYGLALRYAGRFNEAVPNFQKAIRLNPVKPLNYLNNLAWAYTFLEQYEQAILLWNGTLERNPDYLFSYLGLTLAYQLSGNEVKAREAAAEVIRIKPGLTISKMEKGPATKNVDRKRMFEELRKAGIPE